MTSYPSFPDITTPLANCIYDILVRECGATNEWRRAAFLHQMIGRPSIGSSGEFRFEGNLGIGGKFYVRSNGEVYISCYPEDRTPARDAAILRAMESMEQLSVVRKMYREAGICPDCGHHGFDCTCEDL